MLPWVLLASAPRAATVTVDCAVDDLAGRAGLANSGDVVEITTATPCDLGGATLTVDNAFSITTSDPALRVEIRGTAEPMILVQHGGVGAVVLERLDLRPQATNTALEVREDDVTLRDLDLYRSGSPGGPAIRLVAGVTGAVLERSTVASFSSNTGAGGVQVATGAEATITDCWFQDLTGSDGGAILGNGATVTVLRSRFCNGSAPTGSAIRVSATSTLRLENSVVVSNTGGVGSAAVQLDASTGTVLNNHLVGNTRGAVRVDDGALTFDSNVVLGNGSEALRTANSTTTHAYNLFWDNATDVFGTTVDVTTELTVDPLLLGYLPGATPCDADLRPQEAPTRSPLFDAGDPAIAREDAPGDRNDIGAFGGPNRDPDWDDLDGDGDPYATDCDDADPTRATTLPDLCDASDVDEDCSGTGDDDPSQWISLYDDKDGDGFGDARTLVSACPEDLPNHVADGTDCNDSEVDAHPGAVEVCDLLDNDCDGRVDDVDTGTVFGRDADDDGFGDPDAVVEACERPAGYAPITGPADEDCDDADPMVRPGLPDVCDGLDNDCDGTADDDATVDWFPDDDGDAWGADGSPASGNQCEPVVGAAPIALDCDDDAPGVHPGAAEVCGPADEDCDGLVDEADPDLVATAWFPDQDDDGAGDAFGRGVRSCDAPVGYVDNADDCDDADPLSGATRATFWPDGDDDGFGDPDGAAIEACYALPGYADNADDCNDGNPTANPGETEVAGDQVDNDCDGEIDEGGSGDPGGRVAPPLVAAADPGCRCDAGGASGLGGPTLLLLLAARRRKVQRRGPGAPTG